MEKNVHTFIGCDCEYDDSKIVLFGAPYDSTTSFRPGTRFASSAMRNESFGIETYSPYQDKDLLDVNELSPVYDQTGRSTALACKLLREILLYFYK